MRFRCRIESAQLKLLRGVLTALDRMGASQCLVRLSRKHMEFVIKPTGPDDVWVFSKLVTGKLRDGDRPCISGSTGKEERVF